MCFTNKVDRPINIIIIHTFRPVVILTTSLGVNASKVPNAVMLSQHNHAYAMPIFPAIWVAESHLCSLSAYTAKAKNRTSIARPKFEQTVGVRE